MALIKLSTYSGNYNPDFCTILKSFLTLITINDAVCYICENLEGRYGLRVSTIPLPVISIDANSPTIGASVTPLCIKATYTFGAFWENPIIGWSSTGMGR